MTSKLDVCNRSLLSVGARQQISSVDPSDSSAEADACSILFNPTFEQLARTAHWNCLTNQITLSLIAAASGTPENPSGTGLLPPFPWVYAYAYPSDCLQMRFIVPSNPTGTGGNIPLTSVNNQAGLWFPLQGQIPYTVATMTDDNGDKILIILTNQTQAQAVYTQNLPNPQLWDSQFQAAMVASMGAFLVPALSLSFQLMQISIGIADRLIIQARVADGNEGVTVLDHTPDWIIARAGGQGFGLGYGLFPSGFFVDISWPTV